jgi:predicted dehydrogenase
MVKVGLIGLGFMGQTHLRCYQKLGNGVAKVVAISDEDARRAKGDLSGTWGNIEGAAANKLSMDGIVGTTDYLSLLAMPEVDAVDVCLPTPLHEKVYSAAIRSGKHVLCEKPFARTLAEAKRIAGVSSTAKGFVMPAMCVRFWPAYAWLKRAVVENRFGAVRSATFRRVASAPPGWYRDGARSGGAILDLHVHDTDFVCYLFGKPQSVFSSGYAQVSSEIDHVTTQYRFKEVPHVVAEGGWAMAEGFGFNMAFTVNFEKATLDFDFSRPPGQHLLLSEAGKRSAIDVGDSDGWAEEIRYFAQCVAERTAPSVVTVADAVTAMQVIEAEGQSVRSGKLVEVEG